MSSGLTYGTGALIAAERDDRLMWSLHRAAIARGLSPTVPAGVLAEAWRGGPQHRLSMLPKGCKVEDLSAAQARRVGALVAKCGLDDTVTGAPTQHAHLTLMPRPNGESNPKVLVASRCRRP